MQRNAFLMGFAQRTGLSPVEADSQWAGFSRDLPDKIREKIERGGFNAGKREGSAFLSAYPPADDR